MRWSLFVSVLGFCAGSLSADDDCPITDPKLELKYVSALSEYTKCYWRFLLALDLESEGTIELFKRNGMIPEVLTDIYNNAKLAPTCNKIIDELGFTCIPLEGRRFMNVTQRAYHQVLEYMFGNKFQRSIDFIENGGFQCFIREKLFDKYFTYPESSQHILHKPLSKAEIREVRCGIPNNEQNDMETLIAEKCPTASTYVSDLVKIIKPAVCTSNKVSRQKREIPLEIVKYGLLSFLPSKKRVVREINGGNKESVFENKITSLCPDNKELNETIARMKLCLGTIAASYGGGKNKVLEKFDTCFNETRIILGQCLPEKLKYLPNLFFDVGNSLLKYAFDDSNEIEYGLVPCVLNYQTESDRADGRNCIIKVAEDFGKGNLESKEESCAKLISVSECYVKTFATCPTNNSLEKFKKDIKKAIYRPCEGISPKHN